MKTDSNQKIDKRYYLSYHQLQKTIKEKMIVYESNLDLYSLGVDERIVKLYRIKFLIDQEITNFKWQDYLIYASMPEALRIVYRHNFIYKHDHEDHKMYQALILFEKKQLIDQLIQATLDQLSLFTFDSYLRSESNVVFYQLNRQPSGTSNVDYAKMIKCQIRNREECICSLLLRFREKFMAIHPRDDHFVSEAKKEGCLLRELLESDNQLTLSHFRALLQQLKVLDDFSWPQDPEKLYHSFLAFLAEPKKNSRINPREFKQTLQHIQEGVLPDNILFGLTLIRYEAWLNDLVNGTERINDHFDSGYDQLFDSLDKEKFGQGMQKIDQFKKQYPSKCLTAEEYEKVIHQALKNLKNKADQLKEAVYYQYSDDVEMLKCYFIINCMESKDFAYHAEQLSTAMCLKLEISFMEQELQSIGKGIKITLEDIQQLHCHFSMVIAHMVPSRQIIIKKKAAFEKAMQASKHKKPLMYVLEDLNHDLNQVYEEAEDNLWHFVEQQPYTENLTYALKCLDEIEFMKYKAVTRGHYVHDLFYRLEKILRIKIDYYLKIPNNGLAALDKVPDMEADPKNTSISFQFNGNESWITAVLIKLNKRYRFLDPLTMNDFLRVLTSQDLSQEKVKFNIKCNTNIFKCIIDHLKPYFKNLTYANIEHSGLFISKRRTPITEVNLKGSKLKNEETIRAIGSYFVI